MTKRRPIPDLSDDRDAILAKLHSKSQLAESGCREWTGHQNRWGYGETTWRNRVWMVTRLAYAAQFGPFDPALEVCHTCDNPACFEFSHLWLGTHKENIHDSIAKGRHAHTAATHCKRGHPLEGANLYVSKNGLRNCKVCARARMRIEQGWPERLAYTLGLVPHGYSWWDVLAGRVSDSALDALSPDSAAGRETGSQS